MTLIEIIAVVFVVAALKVAITNEVRNWRNRRYRRDALVFYDRQKTK